MKTRKAPGARGRGRRMVLTTAFAMVLMLVLCLAPAAFAVPKTHPDAPGASGSAAGHSGELPATANAPTATPGLPPTQPGPPAKEPEGSAADGPHAKDPTPSGPAKNAGAPVKNKTRVWEPNQPVTDKYDGPCTRHEDTDRKGAGHDWHRGEGVGHSGVKPSDEATESTTPTDTPPPSDPEMDTPSAEDTLTVQGDDPDDEPFLPFTPTPPVRLTIATPTAVKQSSREAEAFLPFTGGSANYLLLLAAACALGGGVLRGQNRALMHAHKRIAR
ncbi:MAG: hypothetical protein ACYC6C_01695 [Coriobacteriia bacterium]